MVQLPRSTAEAPLLPAPAPRFPRDPRLVFEKAPPLDLAWLAHEAAFNLLAPKAVFTDPVTNQKHYSDTCKAMNKELLAGRDEYLTKQIVISDTSLGPQAGSADTHVVPIREYRPISSIPVTKDVIIYFHGGGLYVGDLDSEDLSCRRICKALNCTVYSCTYRKLPLFTADESLSDALYAFGDISSGKKEGKLVVMGSSSGGRKCWRRSNSEPQLLFGCFKPDCPPNGLCYTLLTLSFPRACRANFTALPKPQEQGH